MIKLFYAATPIGAKAITILEELGLEYEILPINLQKKVQLSDAYKKIVPNRKIPAMIDTKDGNKLKFESGSILMDLAYKNNKLIPNDLSWFFWEYAELSPKFLQYYKISLLQLDNKEMYKILEDNIKASLKILNTHLEDKKYIDGDEFTIIDISAYPWIKHYIEKSDIINNYSNILEWIKRVDIRDSIKKATETASKFDWNAQVTEEEIINFAKN